jgi:hypothetical protein
VMLIGVALFAYDVASRGLVLGLENLGRFVLWFAIIVLAMRTIGDWVNRGEEED